MSGKTIVRDWQPNGIAWQKQLRDQYLDDPGPPDRYLDLKAARVKPVSREVAEEIILRYEWLGTMSATTLHFGLFFGPFIGGVTCVGGTGCTAGTRVGARFGLPDADVMVLARGACAHWAPPGANSRLVSWTARLLERSAQARLLIAYADPSAGEYGTIYQASNWVCVGTAGRYRYLKSPSGKRYDDRALDVQAKRLGTKRADLIARLLAQGWEFIRQPPKFCYATVLDRSDRALIGRIAAMRQPYPRRPKQ